MIFDWIGNSTRMEVTCSVTLDDEWDRKHVWRQETNLLRYLAFNRKHGRERCRSIWDSLEGGTSKSGARDGYDVDKAFSNQMATALRLGPLEEIPIVWLTDSEISFVNSLQAPVEVKRYWLRLLVYIKSEKAQNRLPKRSTSVCAYMRRNAGFRMDGGQSARRERFWSIRCGVPFPVDVFVNGKTAFGFYKIASWMCKGQPAVRVSMGHFYALDTLVYEKSFTCVNCGRRFSKSAKGKTELCPVCWERKNRKNKRSYMERKKKQR